MIRRAAGACRSRWDPRARGEPAADRQQRGHARGGVLRVELRDRLVDQPRRSRRRPARGSTSCPRRRGDPVVAGSPPSSTNGSIREPSSTGAGCRCRSPASCAWHGCGRRSTRTIRPTPDRRPPTSTFTTPDYPARSRVSPRRPSRHPDSPRRRPGRRCGRCVGLARASARRAARETPRARRRARTLRRRGRRTRCDDRAWAPASGRTA